jgi:sortase (surface protein transpeptidase)
MKKEVIIVVILLTSISLFSTILVIKYFDEKTSDEYKKLMKIAEENINTVVDDENMILTTNESQNDTYLNNKKTDNIDDIDTQTGEIIGILKIKKININAPIEEGTSQSVLKYSIGHFSESNMWQGNVALAAHNRGSYEKYFKDINQLEENDEIQYITKYRN